MFCHFTLLGKELHMSRKQNSSHEEPSSNKPKRSPIPLYLAGAAWVLYALFFPLYRWWDFLLIALLSGGIFFVAYFLIRPKKKDDIPTKEEALAEEERTPLTDVERAVAECELYRSAMKKIKLKLFAINPNMTLEVVHLEKSLGKIASHLEKYPEDAPKVRRFTDYYMPTALKHLQTYLDIQGVKGQNAASISSNVEGILHTLSLSFDKLLDNLYADDALDISSDITVLEQLLAQEGLINEKNAPSEKE